MLTIQSPDNSFSFTKDILLKCTEGESCFKENLGWLDIDKWAGEEHLTEFEAVASEIKASADAVLVAGVGGSNNAARSVIKALEDRLEGPAIFWVGNSTSSYSMNKALAKCKNKSVYCIVIAKNFETLEPGIAFRALRTSLNIEPNRFICIGTPGSQFENLCKKHGFRFITFAPDIGGRYTALSSVGLLPMASAGVNIRQLVKGAKDMKSLLLSDTSDNNPAWIYACTRNNLYKKGFATEILCSFDPRLSYFFRWWIQLFGESEGKDGKGLFPACAQYSEELHSMGQFIQDGSRTVFETFLTVTEPSDSFVLEKDSVEDGFSYIDNVDFSYINKKAEEATIKAHSTVLPCIRINIDKLDEYHFGQLFFFFEFACYLSGRILKVNPFDQNGVEAYKKLMFESLGKKRS